MKNFHFIIRKSSTHSHAWVLDEFGCFRERRVITARYAFCLLNHHTESKEFVHANFGWEDKKTDTIHSMRSLYRQGTCQPRSQ